MNFNSHRELEGKHSILSPSKYSWIRYDQEKMLEYMRNRLAAERGTELHAFAAQAIRLGVKLQRTKQTLNMYVNDAISFRMSPEVILYYSDNAFGSADAISFRRERGSDRFKLRVHDLKTGVGRTSVNQLEIYAALFCLEYGFKPHEIDIELRIYQNDYAQQYEPDPVDVVMIMDKIETFDQLINNARLEDLS